LPSIIINNKVIEYTIGSAIGRDHLYVGGGPIKPLVGRGNQDAYATAEDENFFIAVITDGCSEGEHSEVGANFGANFIAHRFREKFHRSSNLGYVLAVEDDMERIRQDMLATFRLWLCNFPGNLHTNVSNYALFTIMGVMIRSMDVVIFSIGDGYWAMNGSLNRIGPFPNNEPPYMGYGLVTTKMVTADPTIIRFKCIAQEELDSIENLLIASDGLVWFIKNEDVVIPGHTRKVGNISQFWESDTFYKNETEMSRFLKRCNYDVQKVENGRLKDTVGLLNDDTTVFALRTKDIML